MKPTRERAILALAAMLEPINKHRWNLSEWQRDGCQCPACEAYRAAMAILEKP